MIGDSNWLLDNALQALIALRSVAGRVRTVRAP